MPRSTLDTFVRHLLDRQRLQRELPTPGQLTSKFEWFFEPMCQRTIDSFAGISSEVSGMNNTNPPPRFFAWYIAKSAKCTNVSSSLACSGKIEMPILAPIERLVPLWSKGSPSAWTDFIGYNLCSVLDNVGFEYHRKLVTTKAGCSI